MKTWRFSACTCTAAGQLGFLMAPVPDHYGSLGVGVTASDEEIRKAFKQLALKHHPDRNPDNPDATTQFQKIQAAYEVLSSPSERRSYDLSRKYAEEQQHAASRTAQFQKTYSYYTKQHDRQRQQQAQQQQQTTKSSSSARSSSSFFQPSFEFEQEEEEEEHDRRYPFGRKPFSWSKEESSRRRASFFFAFDTSTATCPHPTNHDRNWNGYNGRIRPAASSASSARQVPPKPKAPAYVQTDVEYELWQQWKATSSSGRVNIDPRNERSEGFKW